MAFCCTPIKCACLSLMKKKKNLIYYTKHPQSVYDITDSLHFHSLQ